MNQITKYGAHSKFIDFGPGVMEAKHTAVRRAIFEEARDNGSHSFALYVRDQLAREVLTKQGEQAVARGIEAACAKLGRLVFSTPEGIAALLSHYGKIPRGCSIPKIKLDKPVSSLSKAEKIEIGREYFRALERLKGLSGPEALKCVEQLGLTNDCICDVADRVRQKLDGRDKRLPKIVAARAAVNKAVEKLILPSLSFVPSIAALYRNRGLDLMDLVSEGNIGLTKAALKFNHHFGFSFSACAEYWIRQIIERAIHNDSRLISLPVVISENMEKVTAVQNDYQSKAGRKPEPIEIATRIGVPAKKAEELLRLRVLGRVDSLADPLYRDQMNEGEDGQLIGQIANESVVGPDRLAFSRKGLAEIKAVLSPRESEIVYRRLGLDQTCKEIAPDFGVTQVRIKQIHNRALQKIAELGL